MAEPYYTTIADLRTALDDISEADLSDEKATALLEDAEDIIDDLLGGWFPDETTGRKITEDQVIAWQWTKLGRATLQVAAQLHADPKFFERGNYQSISGPDFSMSGPRGGMVSRQILLTLDASGLRRIAGRAHPGGNRFPARADSFFRSQGPGAW